MDDVPVSKLLRHGEVIEAGTSIARAASTFRTSNFPCVLVSSEDKYIGVVTEAALLKAMANGLSSSEPVGQLLESCLTVRPSALRSEAIAALEQANVDHAAVVDADSVVWGWVLPSDLYDKAPHYPPVQPPGGLATPFGVYLHTGGVWAGPRPWGLFAAGSYLVILLVLGQVLAYGVAQLTLMARQPLPGGVNFVPALGLVLAAVLMKLSPLAGIHAAEHMAVHAIERQEPLREEVLVRMPRVHPRCGTNLAVLGIVVLGLGTSDLGLPPGSQGLQFIGAFLIGYYNYVRFGGLAQYWITTRTPNKEQVLMGCRSANELMSKAATAGKWTTNGWQAIWNSGLIHVLIGGWITGALFYAFFTLIHRPELVPF